MATRLTVHVRHNKPNMMFYKTEAVKTYYYKDKGKDKLIGNQEAYDNGYQYSWRRSDKGGGMVDHWYLSNCYKCN